MIKLIVADRDESFVSEIRCKASFTDDIYICCCVSDGAECMEAVEAYKPDILVLGSELSGVDGIGVMKELSEKCSDYKPEIIFVPEFYSEVYVHYAHKYGAVFEITDRENIDRLFEAARIIVKLPKKTETEDKLQPNLQDMLVITHIIDMTKIPKKLFGYNYLAGCVYNRVNIGEFTSPTTEILYAHVAEYNNSSARNVERAIRNGVEVAWKNDKTGFGKLFGYELDKKPTNTELIAMLTERFVMEKAKL